eukprot:Amastigsp_a842633_145.p7 type:complete len:102 gc:universal Amastigsp_a842633_145:2046-2351(+)
MFAAGCLGGSLRSLGFGRHNAATPSRSYEVHLRPRSHTSRSGLRTARVTEPRCPMAEMSCGQTKQTNGQIPFLTPNDTSRGLTPGIHWATLGNVTWIPGWG